MVRPHRNWLKWLGAIAVILVLCLTSVYFGWRNRAASRFDQLLAAYRSAGQPTTLADLKHAPIPDDQNAGLLYLKAGAAIQDRKKRPVLSEFAGNIELCRQRPDEVSGLIESNSEPLALLHQARPLKACDFGVQFTSPSINVLFPYLADIRALARLGNLDAIQSHMNHDEAAALERVFDLFALSRAARSDSHTVIQLLVGISIDAVACQTVEIIRTGAVTDGAGTHRPDPQQFRTLIHDLLDEAPLRRTFHDALLGERVTSADNMLVYIDTPQLLGAAPPGPLNFLLRPILLQDLTQGVDRLTKIADLAESPNIVEALKRYPHVEDDSNSSLTTHLSDLLISSFERVVVLYFRNIAERRMAACALAIPLYEHDRGKLPATLNDLVPDYLSDVPSDPMSADNRPIAYRPVPETPILYSVGENGRDEAGRERERGKDTGPDDHAFYIFGNRPPPPQIPISSAPDDEEEQDPAGHE